MTIEHCDFCEISCHSVRTALNLFMLRGRHTPNILESQQRAACECSKVINKQKYKTPLLMNMMLQNQFKILGNAFITLILIAIGARGGGGGGAAFSSLVRNIN